MSVFQRILPRSKPSRPRARQRQHEFDAEATPSIRAVVAITSIGRSVFELRQPPVLARSDYLSEALSVATLPRAGRAAFSVACDMVASS